MTRSRSSPVLQDQVRARVRAAVGRHLRHVRGARAWLARQRLDAGCRGAGQDHHRRPGGVALRAPGPPRPVAPVACGWRTVVVYGLVAVAATQFFYFSAVSHMEVGPALLIEYTAPAAIVLWLWLRHGERPSPVTLVGAGVAGLGLVLVLDLVSGAELSLVGVAWSLAAMVGCAIYFVLSADEGNGLPPIALAAAGMVVGAVSLGAAGPGRPAGDGRRHQPGDAGRQRRSSGGCRCCCSAWSPPRSRTSPASPPAAGWARGWRRSSRCSRSSSACCGPGCCWTSCRVSSSSSVACSSSPESWPSSWGSGRWSSRPPRPSESTA